MLSFPGYRYELYCVAKAHKTTHCIVSKEVKSNSCLIIIHKKKISKNSWNPGGHNFEAREFDSLFELISSESLFCLNLEMLPYRYLYEVKETNFSWIWKRLCLRFFGTQERLPVFCQGIEGIDITLGGESVKHVMPIKCLGIILDSTSLSLNQHVDYIKKKVSKMVVIFSRVPPSLTIESRKRLFKLMILPILDYCFAVFHGCGKGNEEVLEHLQRHGGRIVLNTAHLSTLTLMEKSGNFDM